ncbi:MAG: hypothetical protein FD167_4493 [bacterium]|nr:MAG: hypothetical protein FD167_4493 [bacterium]
MYGLEIIEANNDVLGLGSMYVYLAKLEKKGLISSRPESDVESYPRRLFSSRPEGDVECYPRRLYQITDNGRTYLDLIENKIKVQS